MVVAGVLATNANLLTRIAADLTISSNHFPIIPYRVVNVTITTVTISTKTTTTTTSSTVTSSTSSTSSTSTSTSSTTTSSTSSTSTSTSSTTTTISVWVQVPITIKNPESNATPASFQQSITVDSSTYNSYEASNLQNVFFYYSNGTVIPSWLQYNGGSTAVNNIYWLKFSNPIPASSSLNIYMGFVAPNINLFDGKRIGEMAWFYPANSSYGAYDNGASIFNFYDNFVGNTLNTSKWVNNCAAAGNEYCTVDDSLVIWNSSSKNYLPAIYTKTYKQGQGVVEFYGYLPTVYTSSSPYSDVSAGLSSSSNILDDLASVGNFGSSGYGALSTGTSSGVTNTVNGLVTTTCSKSCSQILSTYSIIIPSNTPSHISAEYNYTTSGSGFYQNGIIASGADMPTLSQPLMFQYQLDYGATYDSALQFYWVRSRAYPPSGVMPGVTFGAANVVGTTTSSTSTTSTSSTTTTIYTGPLAQVPINIKNTQSMSAPSPFQEMLTVNSLAYKQYEASNLQNVFFYYPNNTIITSWLESGNTNTSTNTLYWLKFPVFYGSWNETVYMGFASPTVNLFADYAHKIGEAPELSSSYGQYDDGANVFDYYNVSPQSVDGWGGSGTAIGQTSSAPINSHYGTSNALYANSAGDFLYRSIPALFTGSTPINEIFSFDVYTTGLGDFFFLTDPPGSGDAGEGLMARLDGRGGSDYSGLATTSSWTSWSNPSSGLSESKDTWYKYDVLMSGSTANAYIGPVTDSLGTLGTHANGMPLTYYGEAIGLVGDNLGGSYITYWDGFVLRANPPNEVMPSATFGAIQTISHTVTLTESPAPANYTWRTCFNVSGNYGYTCIGAGGNDTAGPTITKSYPAKTNVTGVCTAIKEQSPFLFSSWNGAYSGTNPCLGSLWGGSFTPIPITSNITIIASYTSTSTTSTSSTSVSVTSTIGVNPQGQALSSINSGQPITLNLSTPLIGVPPYSYQWYSGKSSTCTSDSQISGQTGINITVYPTSNTYYCARIIDSATVPVTFYTATDPVNVIPPSLAPQIQNPVIINGTTDWISSNTGNSDPVNLTITPNGMAGNTIKVSGTGAINYVICQNQSNCLSPGNYTVTATDTKTGTTKSTSLEVTQAGLTPQSCNLPQDEPPAGQQANMQTDQQYSTTYVNPTSNLDYIISFSQQATSPDQNQLPTKYAYLLNGVANNCYWYQWGIEYNWDTPNRAEYVYEIFFQDKSLISFNGLLSGPVNFGDSIELQMFIPHPNPNDLVYMSAYDLQTGAQGDAAYSAYGATSFQPVSTLSSGYFTGVMTEIYNPNVETPVGVAYVPQHGSVQDSNPIYLIVDSYCTHGSDGPQPCPTQYADQSYNKETTEPINPLEYAAGYTLNAFPTTGDGSQGYGETLYSDGTLQTGLDAYPIPQLTIYPNPVSVNQGATIDGSLYQPTIQQGSTGDTVNVFLQDNLVATGQGNAEYDMCSGSNPCLKAGSYPVAASVLGPDGQIYSTTATLIVTQDPSSGCVSGSTPVTPPSGSYAIPGMLCQCLDGTYVNPGVTCPETYECPPNSLIVYGPAGSISGCTCSAGGLATVTVPPGTAACPVESSTECTDPGQQLLPSGYCGCINGVQDSNGGCLVCPSGTAPSYDPTTGGYNCLAQSGPLTQNQDNCPSGATNPPDCNSCGGSTAPQDCCLVNYGVAGCLGNEPSSCSTATDQDACCAANPYATGCAAPSTTSTTVESTVSTVSTVGSSTVSTVSTVSTIEQGTCPDNYGSGQGAINYPDCDQCYDWEYLSPDVQGGSCWCNSGAIDPPDCTLCPEGQYYDYGTGYCEYCPDGEQSC